MILIGWLGRKSTNQPDIAFSLLLSHIIFLLYCIGKKRAHILSELCDGGWLFTTDVSAIQGVYITTRRPECYGRICC